MPIFDKDFAERQGDATQLASAGSANIVSLANSYVRSSKLYNQAVNLKMNPVVIEARRMMSKKAFDRLIEALGKESPNNQALPVGAALSSLLNAIEEIHRTMCFTPLYSTQHLKENHAAVVKASEAVAEVTTKLRRGLSGKKSMKSNETNEGAGQPSPEAIGSVIPCGCKSARIRTTREFEGLEGCEVIQGYTCECGNSFYVEPR